MAERLGRAAAAAAASQAVASPRVIISIEARSCWSSVLQVFLPGSDQLRELLGAAQRPSKREIETARPSVRIAGHNNRPERGAYGAQLQVSDCLLAVVFRLIHAINYQASGVTS